MKKTAQSQVHRVYLLLTSLLFEVTIILGETTISVVSPKIIYNVQLYNVPYSTGFYNVRYSTELDSIQ